MPENKPSSLIATDKQALAELEKKHPEIKQMGQNEKKIMLNIVQSFSGPIPPPDTMVEYGKINASFPERIMRMAEKEQENRHKTNNSLVTIVKTSQYLAAVLVVFLSWIGYRSLVLGHLKCAIIIFGITIGALLTAYLNSDNK